jgi:septal ring factor EnvC (AmiA/AmiB activator)
VVQHFGKVKLASFKDVLFSKGIEFSATESEKVHAVMGGTVAFAGNLPGYDTVVIIDHGARSYSLYGRLGQSLVKKDQVVDQDEVVGTASVADKQGRNFYFEVRRAGKPVDPESVLPRVSR